MTRCAMAVCTKTGSAVNYNRFPNLPKISNVWIQRCKWEEKWNPNLCRVCSNHFTADYFERDLNAKPLEMLLTRRLKCDALPSLNLTINNDNDHPPLDAIYSLRMIILGAEDQEQCNFIQMLKVKARTNIYIYMQKLYKMLEL